MNLIVNSSHWSKEGTQMVLSVVVTELAHGDEPFKVELFLLAYIISLIEINQNLARLHINQAV
jgi:hypothetical protein